MAENPPMRVCHRCGQLWSSARFLDPTITADCGFCEGSLVRAHELMPVVEAQVEPEVREAAAVAA